MLPYLLLSALLVTVPALAGIYRWVDENGQTVYSQTPPPDRNADKIRLALPPSGNPEEAQRRLEEQLQRKDDYLEDRELARDKRKEQQAQQDMRESNCAIARKNHANLVAAARRLVKMPDGKYQRLTEEERQIMLQKAQANIDKNCR